MRALAESELRAAGKRLLARIHPDRFACDARAAAHNSDAFKTVGQAVEQLSLLIRAPDAGAEPRPRAATTLHPLRLRVGDTLDVEHLLPLLASGAPGANMSWQEWALSLFHLFAKARVEFDPRIVQALVAAAAPPQQTIYGCVGAAEDFSLERAASLFRTLTCVHIGRDLCPASRLAAVRSVWGARETLFAMQQQRPGLRVLVTNTRGDLARRADPALIHVPPVFSPDNLPVQCDRVY